MAFFIIYYILMNTIETAFDKFEKWYKNTQKIFTPSNDLNLREFITSQPYRKITIPRNHYLGALVAQEVYNDVADRKDNIEYLELDKRFNTERTVVYKTSMNYDEIFFIGIRGTSSSIIDLASDLLIVTGKDNLSIRKNLQIKFIKEIIETLNEEGYDKNKSYVCGHSLGGLMVTYILEAVKGIKGIGFNTGSSPAQSSILSKWLITTPVLQNLTDQLRFTNYHMKGDLISLSSKYLYRDTIELNPIPPAENAIEAHKLSFLLNHTQPSPAFRK